MRSGSPRTSRTLTSPRARSAPPSESGRPPAHQERALALDPAHSGALNELGRISLHRGGHPRAASHFIQAARSAPGVSTYGRNVELLIQHVLALMPPEMRLLFRTRRVGLALGAVYGAVLIELITAAVTPAPALPFAIFATTALILASPFVARASLRRKGNKAGRDATHDRATSR
jgi:hypothetical protein